MVTFVSFVLAVAIYIAFLLWCLSPLVRRPRRRGLGWLRVVLGLLLLGANLLPLLAFPILLPIYVFNPEAGRWFTAVALFARTLPIYVFNVIERASATATVVDVTYPIAIGGVRYAPVVRTACTTRKMVDIDYGAALFFENFPTASGGELIAQDANTTLALDQSPQLCSMTRTGRLQLGPFPDYRTRIGTALRAYVVRGEADKTQVYELHYDSGAVAVDDIVLQPPEIVRIDQAPASDVVSIDALWPMRQQGESGFDVLAMIEAYRRLPAGINSCVEFVYASMDFSTMTPRVSRPRQTDYPQTVPVALRPAYCRGFLWWRIPQPTKSRLTPVGG